MSAYKQRSMSRAKAKNIINRLQQARHIAKDSMRKDAAAPLVAQIDLAIQSLQIHAAGAV